MRWILLLLLCAGCAVDRGDRVQHWIVGFGVVSVPKTNCVASTTRVGALGLWATQGSAVLGWSYGVQTLIQATATNTIIEVKP